ncbi:conserved hypothetical protein [Culex quinquefasciatus]|uniref:Uncharacterized protein n=1 Tax=Culex quinquefasciatus TaxID=7176 RepID=B0XB45_CULQU|nr:conserved hypothetical protein [Culex quinquefasciatus]|eukprot:XP_001866867.1 conserved hypothetical protein [Culex quinquefasciatus]
MDEAVRSLQDGLGAYRAELPKIHLKQSLKALNQRTQNVAQAVNRQEATFEDQKRAELSSNAVVLGIPRESNEDVLDVITKACETLGYHGL